MPGRRYKIYQKTKRHYDGDTKTFTVGDNYTIETLIFVGKSRTVSEQAIGFKVVNNDTDPESYPSFTIYINGEAVAKAVVKGSMVMVTYKKNRKPRAKRIAMAQVVK